MKNILLTNLIKFLFVFSISLFAVSCVSGNKDDDEDDPEVVDPGKDDPDNSTFSKVITITYGNTVTIDNPANGKGVTVTQSNGDVVVKSTIEEVEYILKGSTTSGSFKIYSDFKFKLTLDGVSIKNNDGAAINIQTKKSAFIVLKDNTTSSLSDTQNYATTTEDMKGTLFSEGQLLFSGKGTLNVSSVAHHAICVDDYVRISSGTINVKFAAFDALHAKDYIVIEGGTVILNSSIDALQCSAGPITIEDGDITINAADEGICATYEDGDPEIDPSIYINGGKITVVTDGESANGILAKNNVIIKGGDISVKTSKNESVGIEAKNNLEISGGTIVSNSYHNGLAAKNNCTISGGKIYAKSAANNGLSVSYDLSISGSTFYAVGANLKNGIKCDNISITGGNIVSVGTLITSPNAKTTTQPVVLYSGTAVASQIYRLEDSASSDVVTVKIPSALSTMQLLFSSPSIKIGTSYTILKDGTVSGGEDFNGFYKGETYSGGTEMTTFAVSSNITSVRPS